MVGNERSGRSLQFKHQGKTPEPPKDGWQRAYLDSKKNPAVDHLKRKLKSGAIKPTDQPHHVYNNDTKFHCLAPSKFPGWFAQVVADFVHDSDAASLSDTRTTSRAPSASNRSSSLATSTTAVSTGPSPRPPTNIFKMDYDSSDDDSPTAPTVPGVVRCEIDSNNNPTHVTPLLSGGQQHFGNATVVMNESYIEDRADGKGATIRIWPAVGQTATQSAVVRSKEDDSVIILASGKGDRTNPKKIQALYTKGHHVITSGKGKKRQRRRSSCPNRIQPSSQL